MHVHILSNKRIRRMIQAHMILVYVPFICSKQWTTFYRKWVLPLRKFQIFHKYSNLQPNHLILNTETVLILKIIKSV